MHLINIEYEGKTYQLLGEGPLRLIRDLELARILGFKRRRGIRELIKRHMSSLGNAASVQSASARLDLTRRHEWRTPRPSR